MALPATPDRPEKMGLRRQEIEPPGRLSGMSASPAAPPAAITPEPVEAKSTDHKDDLRSKHAHAGVAMAVATLAMALTSGIQAVLYVWEFGIDARTDGFFVAFSLYAIFGVFSQSIRITSAPMMVGDDPRMTPRQFAAALLAIAAPVAIFTVPLAGLTAELLAPGLHQGAQEVTASALPILGCAMILQLWAAGGATVLAIRDRFDRVAFAYIAGAVVGLLVFIAVYSSADELSLGWSMLAMAIVTSVAMLAGVRASRSEEHAAPKRRIDARVLAHSVGLVLGRTAVYLAFNGLYVVTLAFASFYDPGDATLLSYVYLFSSYLVAATGFALGMSRIADMRRGVLTDWREVIADTVPAGFRYAMMLVAPGLAALIAGGATLMGELLPSSFDSADVTQLRAFAALLVLWTVAALVVNLLLPAMFALDRAKIVNALAPAIVVVHIGVTAVAGALFGANGVVGAFFIVPTFFAGVLLVVGAGRGSTQILRELGRDGLRFGLLSLVCFGIGAAIGSAFGGLAAPLLAIGIGSLLYALLTSRLAPRQMRLLVGAVRPASA
jgi:hypothetical protein